MGDYVGVPRLIAGIGFFVASLICGFVRLSYWLDLQQEVNSRVEPQRRVDPTFWSLLDYERFRRLRDGVLPASSLHNKMKRVQILMCSLGLIAVVILFGPELVS